MGFLNIFKKKKKEVIHMSTLDEVRKAYEDLSDEDKKAFSQSIAEPKDGSAAEEDGKGKPAEDREIPVPEEKGAEETADEADGDKETVEPEPTETDDGEAEWRKNTDARLSRIEEALGQIMQQGKRTPAPADGGTAERLKRAESIYS